MHVYLTGRHLELTRAIHAHVERHLVEPVARHTGLDLICLEVQLYRANDRGLPYGCHAQVELPRHNFINIREEDSDLYAAIDLTEARLVHALADVKQKWVSESKRPHKLGFARLGRALGWMRRYGRET
jgi:ribosomal subunit interface protein